MTCIGGEGTLLVGEVDSVDKIGQKFCSSGAANHYLQTASLEYTKAFFFPSTATPTTAGVEQTGWGDEK